MLSVKDEKDRIDLGEGDEQRPRDRPRSQDCYPNDG